MVLTDKTTLHDVGQPQCHVRPVVLFSIIDHYSRREDGQDRVIGTLLGTEADGVVQVCSCFPVPHTEMDDQVAVSTDFHATMLQLHQRVHPKHKVVGWYSTGEEVNGSSMLFHEFYGQDVERPVHLLLDLGLGERRMSCKAYTSVGLELGHTLLGTVFEEIKLTVVNGEADQLGLDTLLKASADAGSTPSSVNALNDVDTMEVTIKKLLRTLEGVMEHVEKVTQGKAEADPKVVRLLQDLVASAPRLPAAAFDKMFNAQVQDILAVVYLANLTRTQLALAEKLQAVALSGAL
ncbi:hypothetical protein AB1Y20_007574 [Prymnesium parvum]|uniref:Eukaryotic translation initiation factor 3 subunit F n=1 Tax=Prymnesium parvum TaxID=97485 RepID=A0AB34IVL8_PRYPA